MAGPELTWAALRAASNQVREAAHGLHVERERVATAFDTVIGGSWTGRAAASFREIHHEWNQGLNEVEQGLVSMAELIDAARSEFQRAEDDVVDRIESVSMRIIDRLSR